MQKNLDLTPNQNCGTIVIILDILSTNFSFGSSYWQWTTQTKPYVSTSCSNHEKIRSCESGVTIVRTPRDEARHTAYWRMEKLSQKKKLQAYYTHAMGVTSSNYVPIIFLYFPPRPHSNIFTRTNQLHIKIPVQIIYFRKYIQIHLFARSSSSIIVLDFV